MQRLFGLTGSVVLISAALALLTRHLVFRISTVVSSFVFVWLYLWLQRSLPTRRGSLCLQGLKEAVEVYRDDRGVPHIYARNLHDLYLAQGYITAQDRLWSMDLNRRAASGRMAEIFGPDLLKLDKHFRTLGLRRAAQASLLQYSPRARGYLEAYAAGVNARIAEDRLPPEFRLVRYRPEPWDPVDTLVLGKWLAYAQSGNWAGELFRARLVQSVGAEKAAELFWLPPDLDQLMGMEEIALPDVDELLELASQTVHHAVGSNSWAIAGSRTRSGTPLLANAPELAVGSPSLWYQTHLTGPDHAMDVIGVTVPGVPGVIMGHTRDIAWGMSALNADVQDIYMEQCHPNDPSLFQYQGHWERASQMREEIRIKGSARPVIHEVLVTRHGPVIARGQQAALALRWTALDPSCDWETFLNINRARTWADFRRALQTFAGPVQHFVFAGKDGTIARKAAGSVPLRARGDGQSPVPGWSGDFEWDGWVPFDTLPESINPPEGYIVAANQDMVSSESPHALGSEWAAPYRASRISEILRSRADLTSPDLRDLQNDRANLQARTLVQTLLHAVQEGLRQGAHSEVLSEFEKASLLLISGWDCEDAGESAAPVLWHQWYLFLLEAIFRPQMGLALFDQFIASGQAVTVADRLIQQVSEGGGSAWLQREGEAGLGRIALRSFRRAVALTAAKHGRVTKRWRWDREHQIRFDHPLATGSWLLKGLLNLGPYPLSGGPHTVSSRGYHPLQPFTVTFAAPWRQVVDLAALGKTEDICAPGQSGHPLSIHHADQMAAWLKGETHPHLFRHDEIRKLPRFVLQPSGGPTPDHQNKE